MPCSIAAMVIISDDGNVVMSWNRVATGAPGHSPNARFVAAMMEEQRSCSATARLDRPTHRCDIVETSHDSWRFKNRDDDHITRARLVSAIPARSGEASASAKAPSFKG